MNADREFLRWAAIVGAGAPFVWRVASLTSRQPRQSWGFFVVVGAIVAIGLTCVTLMPAATGRLRRHVDLLVPLGLYTGLQAFVNFLATMTALSAVLAPSRSVRFLSISFSLSFSLLLAIALAVWYAAWTTKLIVQAVREDRVDLRQGLADMPRCIMRVLGAETFGWVILFAGMAVAISLTVVAMPLVMILIATMSLAWNLTTAALLPVVVTEPKPFLESLREGVRASWNRKGRFWLPVVVQMLLLGWICFISISSTRSPRPGAVTTQKKTDWSINGFWTGGYENECRWHGKLMAAVEAEPIPLAEFLLGLVFAVLAIVVKLHTTALVYQVAEPGQQPPEDLAACEARAAAG